MVDKRKFEFINSFYRAGGHNVIVGIYEYMKSRNPNSQLFGFLEGPIGIIKGNYVEITAEMISYYKNRGKIINFIFIKGDST